MDLILNGQAQGSVAARLLQNNFDLGSMRPWVGRDGRHYVAQMREGKMISVPTTNATATLRRDEWKLIDDSVMIAARERLVVVDDLRSRGLTFSIPNAMGHTVLTTQRMGDITGATISMDPARKSESDRPEFDMVNLPIPVIHKDFQYTARQIATSRNGGTPIDTTTAQLAARKVAEEAEKLVLGTTGTVSYGGGVIYGLTNYPDRLTKVLTAPTAGGWTPQVFINELLDMRQDSYDQNLFGPWVVYLSPMWDQYLDADYSTQYPGVTLRTRIAQISQIRALITVPFLTGKQIIMVQLTTDTIRLIDGMGITTLQWDTDGGMVVNYKVMAIIVPQIRSDINEVTGIIHGTAP